MQQSTKHMPLPVGSFVAELKELGKETGRMFVEMRKSGLDFLRIRKEEWCDEEFYMYFSA
jgi:hypothetical protein